MWIGRVFLPCYGGWNVGTSFVLLADILVCMGCESNREKENTLWPLKVGQWHWNWLVSRIQIFIVCFPSTATINIDHVKYPRSTTRITQMKPVEGSCTQEVKNNPDTVPRYPVAQATSSRGPDSQQHLQRYAMLVYRQIRARKSCGMDDE